tara:strand:+ start:8639 stop:9439 length:801 start_codon:yes stop_codon:yes gene_type:complete
MKHILKLAEEPAHALINCAGTDQRRQEILSVGLGLDPLDDHTILCATDGRVLCAVRFHNSRYEPPERLGWKIDALRKLKGEFVFDLEEGRDSLRVTRVKPNVSSTKLFQPHTRNFPNVRPILDIKDGSEAWLSDARGVSLVLGDIGRCVNKPTYSKPGEQGGSARALWGISSKGHQVLLEVGQDDDLRLFGHKVVPWHREQFKEDGKTIYFDAGLVARALALHVNAESVQIIVKDVRSPALFRSAGLVSLVMPAWSPELELHRVIS